MPTTITTEANQVVVMAAVAIEFPAAAEVAEDPTTTKIQLAGRKGTLSKHVCYASCECYTWW